MPPAAVMNTRFSLRGGPRILYQNNPSEFQGGNTFAVPNPASQAPDPFECLSANMVALRAQGNWTTRALAGHAHVSRNSLVNLENGRSNLSLSTVDKLAGALGVRTGSLFGQRPVSRKAHDESIVVVLALNLISARRALKLTQETLGRQSGVDMYVIAHIERQAHNPSLQTLAKLTVPLHLSLEELLSAETGASGAQGAPQRAT